MVIGNYSKQDNPAKSLTKIFKKEKRIFSFFSYFLETFSETKEGKFSAFFNNST
jgi:hypothetical protein